VKRRLALVALAALVAATGGATRASLLDELRGELSAAEPARRAAAQQRLRAELPAAELPALLAELRTAPPTVAVACERVAIELPRLRAALLRAALDGDDGAALLLAAAFDQRASELAPLRPELAELREARLPWSQPGWRARRTGAPRAAIAWSALDAALRDAGAWRQPVIVLAGALDDGVTAPRMREVAADGWLEVELARRGLVVLRGAVAAWIAPAALAAGGAGASENEKASVELLALRQRERGWFATALARCRELGLARGGAGAGDLLLRCGLDWIDGTSGDAALDAALTSARAALRPGVAPRPAPPDPAAPADEPQPGRRELRESLARLLAPPADGATPPPVDDAWRAALRDVVDLAAGVADVEPLLCGELADALRSAAGGASDPVRKEACGAASAELWSLGRAARPGRALLLLPEGRAAPR